MKLQPERKESKTRDFEKVEGRRFECEGQEIGRDKKMIRGNWKGIQKEQTGG